MALRQLPQREQWEIAQRLLTELENEPVEQSGDKACSPNGEPAPALPDYSARRRRIFGDKVLPNMVLAARAEEPW